MRQYIKLSILLFIFVISFSSCDKERENSLIGKEYIFSLVSSQQECDTYMTWGINCYQFVSFSDNNRAAVMVTDILNRGTYEVKGNQVIIKITSAGDLDNITFEANTDFTELIESSNNTSYTWKLSRPGVNPWDL